jgi:hypothetical protein
MTETPRYVIVTKTGAKDHTQTGKVTVDGYVTKCGIVGELVREGDGRGEICSRCRKRGLRGGDREEAASQSKSQARSKAR